MVGGDKEVEFYSSEKPGERRRQLRTAVYRQYNVSTYEFVARKLFITDTEIIEDDGFSFVTRFTIE